jgi:hypothetical protein
LHEIGRVDTPIVFLQQVGLEFVRPNHHVKVWDKRHAAIPRSRGCRGVSIMPHKNGVHRTEVTVKVAAPLSVALDGDVVVLTRVTGLEFGP